MAQKLKDKAYTVIKERILSCEYEPDTMLNETSLSEELGISRTPIREALSDLEHEMLVTVLPKKGTVVNTIDIDVINDVFQVRSLIEPFIIKKYGMLIGKAQIVGARAKQEQAKTSGKAVQFQIDNDLHQSIIAANRNIYFAETLAKVYDQNQRIRIITGNKNDDRLEASSIEHISIIDCLLCDDYERAAVEMHNHLSNSWRATISVLVR